MALALKHWAGVSYVCYVHGEDMTGAATSLLHSGARSSVVPTELTTLALSHRIGKIVGVTSRAGGVGKTAIAAGLGIIYGEAVQDSGWCAAVVDQNHDAIRARIIGVDDRYVYLHRRGGWLYRVVK